MPDEFIRGSDVCELFNMLRMSEVKYLLLRNIDNELPDRLSLNKDIDILVHPSQVSTAHRVFSSFGWKNVRHPWNFGSNFIFLYSMTPFRMYSKNRLNVDVSYELCCRSPNKGEWTPLDLSIQNYAWKNIRVEPNTVWKYRLKYEEELLHLLTRCIFDKKQFQIGYQKQIEALLSKMRIERFRHQLELVFFKFAPFLEELVLSKQYDKICREYLKFSDY